MRPLPAVYILGAGRVGSALARLFSDASLRLCGVWSRSADRARRAATFGPADEVAWDHGEQLPATLRGAEVALLAVRDEAVAAVAAAVGRAGLGHGLQAVFHCGGARPAAVALAIPELLSTPRGTFHPLVAVTSAEQAARTIPGAFIGLEGDARAVALGELLARSIGARTVRLESTRMALYHAAAVLASNHALALWHSSATLLADAFDRRQARALDDSPTPIEVLLPLIRSNVENVVTHGLPAALTGPVRRGDSDTVRRHIEALLSHDPELAAIYRAGTRAALRTCLQCIDPPEPAEIAALRELAGLQDLSGSEPSVATVVVDLDEAASSGDRATGGQRSR